MIGNQEYLLATFKMPSSWNNDFVETIGDRLLIQLKLKRLGFHKHLYDGRNPAFGGMTMIWFLAESHMILETFREEGILELSLATCKRQMDMQRYHNIFKENGLEVVGTHFVAKGSEHKWLV